MKREGGHLESACLSQAPSCPLSLFLSSDWVSFKVPPPHYPVRPKPLLLITLGGLLGLCIDPKAPCHLVPHMTLPLWNHHLTALDATSLEPSTALDAASPDPSSLRTHLLVRRNMIGQEAINEQTNYGNNKDYNGIHPRETKKSISGR